MEGLEKEKNVQSDKRTLLGKNFEVEKIMRYLREIEISEEI